MRLVEFDCIDLRRSVVSKKRRKRGEMRTEADINLVIMLLGRYLECEVRYIPKRKENERKERKKEYKALPSAGTNGSKWK